MRLLRTDPHQRKLAELALFSDCNRSELARLGSLMTKVTLPAGRVLISEGAPGDELMVIVDGTARVTRDTGAGTTVVATVGRGDVVGEMALLDGPRPGRRTATVTAVTDLEFYVLTPGEFRQVMETAPSVAEKVRRVAEARTEALAAA